ncbi:MAG TPA: hypothetical protein VHX52_04785 [Steroidobacteraceae bacterium]|nr:hypothetical protein [Steroidobacteraceae bacterium]
MLDLPPYVLAATITWFVVCALGAAVIARRWLVQGRRTVQPHGYPGALLNGLLLLAIAPAVSLVQYIGSAHRAFWGGAVDLLIAGLLLIGYHFVLKRRLIGRVARSAMSLREKTIASQIVAILVVYGFYGARLWGQPLTRPDAVGTLVGITVWMIVVSIVFHVTIAAYARSYGKLDRIDERDRLVALLGSRNAYRTLAAGVWCIVVLAIANVPHGLLFYAAMGIFALAELVRLGSELLYYRLGA